LNYLGDFIEDATLEASFTTNDAAGGAVAPSAPFTTADVKIYKDGSATPKTTSNGITVASPFASVTGQHQVSIDTSIDTGDIGFWAKGSNYKVTLEPTPTVAGQTVTAIPATFSIENRFTGELTGSRTITIQLYETATVIPIADVAISVFNSDQTLFLGRKTTDSNGRIVIGRDDGVYKLVFAKAGATFTVPETLTVTEDDTEIYFGDSIVIEPPADPDACRVFEYLFLPNSTDSPETVKATAEIILLPYDKDDKLHSGVVIDGIYNPDTGLVFWDIVKGATAKFIVKDFINVTKVVPDASTARLKDMPS
jgi:hypothetical protein